MATVLLIRHGESESNVGWPSTKPTELVPLTALGQRQSEAVAIAVPPPDLIVTSPYLRSQQTALPTRQRFPDCPQVEWPVQEFDYVVLPPQISDRTEILQLCRAYWQRRDPFYRDGAEAESFAGLMQRVAHLFQQVRQLEGKTVLVFSHSGFIRAVLWAGLMPQVEVTPKGMEQYRNFIQSVRVPNGAIVTLHQNQQNLSFSPVVSHHLQGL